MANFRGMSQTDFWKSHRGPKPIMDEFSKNRTRPHDPISYKKLIDTYTQEIRMDEFSRIQSSSTPEKLKFRKKTG